MCLYGDVHVLLSNEVDFSSAGPGPYVVTIVFVSHVPTFLLCFDVRLRLLTSPGLEHLLITSRALVLYIRCLRPVVEVSKK